MASATPLSPAPSTMMNFATPPTTRRVEHSIASSPVGNDNSSPLVNIPQDAKSDNTTKENVSPSKSRHSRIMSGNEIAPLRILSPRDENVHEEVQSAEKIPMPRSPRKGLFMDKRFPVRVNPTVAPEKPPEKVVEAPVETPAENQHTVTEREMTLEDALKDNEGLRKAIEIFEDDSTVLDGGDDDVDATSLTIDHPTVGIDDFEVAAHDESMMSTFSTFSAVPNLTQFARLGQTPNRFSNMGMAPTPRGRPDPTPSRRPPVMHESGNTTNLMDFTEQLASISRYGTTSPDKTARLPHAKTNGHRPNSTPQRPPSNLLDFDIPPMPTPRSIPTITPREVESLKSTFLSEISSLKATLSGKEAEVAALKTAVTDAEKRVGETTEQLHDLRGKHEAMAEEKDSWEKSGREMQAMLRQLKDEMVSGRREREELEFKLDESEKRREAAEMMAQEAESKMAGMRAGKASSEACADGAGNKAEKGVKSPGNREVEMAVERVARELHGLYKSKHEAKVAALKKSYENRWEKKVRELEVKVDGLLEENEQLKRDATMTKVDPGQIAAEEERKAQAAKDSAHISELNAKIQNLGAVISSVKQDNQDLILLLEKERVEKGELVQLAEEMMSMQHSFIQPQPQEQQQPPPPPPAPVARPTPSKKEQTAAFRSSIGRPPSGLKAPGSLKKATTESRIGGMTHERTKSHGLQGGLPRPGSGTGARSGIMSSIEKMGKYNRAH